MDYEMKELKERFDDISLINKAEDYFLAFCEVLRFISETPSLRSHANKILNDTYASNSTYAVGILFRELNIRWVDDYGAASKVWGDLSRKILGVPTESKVPLIFTSLQSTRSASRIFYLKFVEQVKSQRTSPYNKTPVVIDKAENSIYLAKENTARYSIQNKQKDKAKAPKRFRLVCVLHSQRNAVSIARLNELLDKEKYTQNLKGAIKDINRLFRASVYDQDLIVVEKSGNKNMYSLNNQTFNFRITS